MLRFPSKVDNTRRVQPDNTLKILNLIHTSVVGHPEVSLLIKEQLVLLMQVGLTGRVLTQHQSGDLHLVLTRPGLLQGSGGSAVQCKGSEGRE